MTTKQLLFSVFLTLWATGAQPQSLPWQNPALSAEARAQDLCSRLTLEEKVSLMMNASPAIERLGIPAFEWWNEALHGVGRNGTATVFPATIGMAASWNEDLLFRVFTAVSDEARAKNTMARRQGSYRRYQGLSFWTPNINIFRDPRWGRGQETYGEDPWLTSRMGLAVVRGLQGNCNENDNENENGNENGNYNENENYNENGNGNEKGNGYIKLLACAKHFAVHSGPEWNRHSFNIENLPERDLWETYLPAFKTLVKEGGVQEVMCAYQRIDGAPCCGNTRYLQRILRQDWGFKGLVTSDCGAVGDFWQKGHHEFSPDRESAASRAVVAGTDLECGTDYEALVEAVRRGQVSESQIDESLQRLLKARFMLGNLDPDSLNPWTQIPSEVVACKAHKQLALEMARQSMVLLKNNGVLPLKKSVKRILVMGPNAADSTMLWGNYNGFPTHTTTILEGIRRRAPQTAYVDVCSHTELLASDGESFTSWGGQKPDVVVFVGGISPRLEGEEMKVDKPGFRGGDRTDMEMPQVQRDLIARLHKSGLRVVLVNCSGSAMGLVPESRHADAILQAWYGGEAAGEAVADVLFGDYNPSGHLPLTFYKDISQLPPYEDYTMRGRTYRYFDSQPLYAFGHGLSYTTFKMSHARYDSVRGKVTLCVSNTGKWAGTEVVQVYLRRPSDPQGPRLTLRAFERVSLEAGEKKQVEIDFPRERFEWWDDQTNTMRVLPGTYELLIGGSSDDIRFNITSTL